jgi:hypothetical protein
MNDSYERVLIEDQAQWRASLDANHGTSPTRQARIQRAAADAARNIRANQWRQPAGRQPSSPAPHSTQ